MPVADDFQQAYVLYKTAELFGKEPEVTVGQPGVRRDLRIGRSRKRRVPIPCHEEECQERQHTELGHRNQWEVVDVELGPREEQVRIVRENGWRRDIQMHRGIEKPELLEHLGDRN